MKATIALATIAVLSPSGAASATVPSAGSMASTAYWKPAGGMEEEACDGSPQLASASSNETMTFFVALALPFFSLQLASVSSNESMALFVAARVLGLGVSNMDSAAASSCEPQDEGASSESDPAAARTLRARTLRDRVVAPTVTAAAAEIGGATIAKDIARLEDVGGCGVSSARGSDQQLQRAEVDGVTKIKTVSYHRRGCY